MATPIIPPEMLSAAIGGYLDDPEAQALMQPPLPPDELAAMGQVPPPPMLDQVPGEDELRARALQAMAGGGSPVGADPAPEPVRQAVPDVEPGGASEIPPPPAEEERRLEIDPVTLALKAAEVRRDAERLKLQVLQRADERIKEADARAEKTRLEAEGRAQEAQKRVADYQGQIEAKMKAGPEFGQQAVVATGLRALGSILAALADRTGQYRRQLPQLLSGHVQQGVAEVQDQYERELAALQSGQAAAGDEYDQALEETRRAEQARALAEASILGETERQLQIAAQRGQVDLAELERLGIPGEMTARRQAALQEAARLEEDRSLKRRQVESELATEAVQRRKTRADMARDRERLALQRAQMEADSQRDSLEAHKKAVELALKQKELSEKDLGRAVMMPDGSPILLNSAGAQKEAVTKVATARKLGRLVDEITQAAEKTGYDPKWLGSPEGQKTRLLWRKLWLSVKDQEALGAITGPDEKILDDVTGADPTSFSADALRGTSERLKLLKRLAEDEMHDYLGTASADYSGRDTRFRLPEMESPESAIPTSTDARTKLVPPPSPRTGERPRLDPKDVSANVKTLRESIVREVAQGGVKDELTGEALGDEVAVREQGRALAGALRDARADVRRIEDEIGALQQRGSRGPDGAQVLAEIERLGKELPKARALEKRLGKELERERRLLWHRLDRPKQATDPEDRAVYRQISDLIGPIE